MTAGCVGGTEKAEPKLVVVKVNTTASALSRVRRGAFGLVLARLHDRELGNQAHHGAAKPLDFFGGHSVRFFELSQGDDKRLLDIRGR